MKKFISIILLSVTSLIYSQNGFKDWDKNYKYEDPEKIIQNELDYAKKVDAGEIEGRYYVAMEKFRFLSEFTGNERNISPKSMNSVKTVFKIKTGNSEVLNELVSKELEFNIGKTKIWMPIQNQLIKPFKNEVKKGSKVLLYCLFTNEHRLTGEIVNTFLISEFTTEWD